MRRRVVRVAVTAVTVALILFGLPLAFVAQRLILSEERGELERTALTAAAAVGPGFGAADPAELPRAEGDKHVAVYDASLRLHVGQGPAAADPVVRAAITGQPSDGIVAGEIVVAVPVSSAETVIAVVRASTSSGVVWQWVLVAWGVLAALAAAALVGSVLVARRQARVLSEPLEALSRAADRVADGDLRARSEPGGVTEIQRVAIAQNAMLDRLTSFLLRERHFSADASHQLRTPLAGLQLTLDNLLDAMTTPAEAALRPGLTDAAEQVRALEATVTDLLQLSRPTPDEAPAVAPRALATILSDVETRWHGTLAAMGRRLVIRKDTGIGDDDVLVPGFVVVEILAILLQNAVEHGRGTVIVDVRDLGDALALDVADEGAVLVSPITVFERGQSGGTGTGIGLALARSMVESIGGRLALASVTPTRFSCFLPRS